MTFKFQTDMLFEDVEMLLRFLNWHRRSSCLEDEPIAHRFFELLYEKLKAQWEAETTLSPDEEMELLRSEEQAISEHRWYEGEHGRQLSIEDARADWGLKHRQAHRAHFFQQRRAHLSAEMVAV